MITVVCTRCSKRMTVDDGFAGGVCRCSSCGTIQTVPAEATRMVGATSGKVIFEKPGRPGSNLDELGQIISSSGLVGSGLVSNHRDTKPQPTNRILKPAAIGGAIALLLAVGVLIGLSMRSAPDSVQEKPIQPKSDSVASVRTPTDLPEKSKTTSASRSKKKNESAQSTTRRKSGGLNAIDFSNANVVIFLFDRGEATRNYVDDLQRSALEIARKLGEEKRFQIIYWTANGDTPLAPEVPESPSESIIEATQSQLASIEIPRSTDIEPALEIALEGDPTDIIIASAKGWQLDEDFVAFVIESTKPKSVRVHAIAFSSGPETEALKQIAAETDGQFVVWK